MKEDKFDKYRLPLAILLFALTIIGWQIYNNSKQDNYVPPPTPETNQAPVTAAAAFPADSDASAPAVSSPRRINTGKTYPEKLVHLENDFLRLCLSSKGAVVISNVVKTSKYNNIETDMEVNYLPGHHTGALSFLPDLSYNLTDRSFKLVSSDSKSAVFERIVDLGNETGTTHGTLKLVKTYQLEDWQLKLNVTIENTGRDVLLGNYLVLNGSSIGPRSKAVKKKHFDRENGSYLHDDSLKIEISDQNNKKNTVLVDAASTWISIDSRFYLRTLAASENGLKSIFQKKLQNNNTNLIGAYRVPYQLSGKGIDQKSFTYHMLPKNRGLLNKLHDDTGIQYFKIFKQFSFMKILSYFMYRLILIINNWVNNFGLSIILMTLLIKVVTYPLTQKSHRSMQKMQELSPKIKEINEKHKNNAQQKNIEIMNLYKKEKVNPASGCLPMMIPIPLFIALYSLFQNMIELNLESFLWIDDLSLPDTVYTFSFSIPFLGNQLNILPIIMTAATFIQSHFSPQPSSGGSNSQMAMMKYMMPIMFFFICWNMPAALTLFWTLNSLFTFAQTLISRRQVHSISN